MNANKKNKNIGDEKKKKEKNKSPLLSFWVRKWIKVSFISLIGLVIILSFPIFNKAGYGGEIIFKVGSFLFGKGFYALPIFLFLISILYIKSYKKGRDLILLIGTLILIIGLAGLLAVKELKVESGGWIGFILGKILVGLFGPLIANLFFGAVVLTGLFIFFQFIFDYCVRKEEKKPDSPLGRSEPEVLKIKGMETKQPEPVKVSPRIVLFKKGVNKTESKEKEIKKSERRSETGNYVFPSLDLLNKNEVAPTSGNIKENSTIIKNTLEKFGIPVEMVEVNVGPTVTQYAFKPAEGVKLSKITTLTNNLALALAAHPIRIEAPIPGKSLVGIEVPNKVRSVVALRNLLSHSAFQNSNSPLLIALGRSVTGAPVFTDLTEGPHMLVAGATGTGKTIFLNALILSLLYKNSPQTLRMILIDPKRVEFQHYNEIPHLLCPVIYDASKTINALQWLVKEMERRFRVFSEIPTRNIATYNQNKLVIAKNKQLPYIVFIVDELADLMAAKGREIEGGVVRLAQMARATGIHLVLATQRPSVEVITGLIKANIPTRVTFQVASQVDSRTVLDISGAEKLLGAGDMLFLSSKSTKLGRIQAPYISEAEVKRVVDFIAAQKEKIMESQTMLVEDLREALEHSESSLAETGEVWGEEDPLFEKVKQLVLETRKASASFLQRRLRIGYARAARLIDMLEERGIVGPAEGAKPREVYGEVRFADVNSQADSQEDDSEDSKEDNGWVKI